MRVIIEDREGTIVYEDADRAGEKTHINPDSIELARYMLQKALKHLEIDKFGWNGKWIEERFNGAA